MHRRIKPLDIPDGPFVAIDFETADYGSDSACSVGLMRVEESTIVQRKVVLIRPPRRYFVFTYIHGIRWEHVQDAPTFGTAWPELSQMLEGAQFLAAHNASFDCKVLATCCTLAGLAMPDLPFLCTVQLARKTWRLRSNKLPDVCSHLGLPLRHHDAGSDAEACALIVVEAKKRLAALRCETEQC
jgi:DNA polymerase-3 subunit epsilon